MMGLHWVSPGSMSLRMMRNIVKLSTSVTLKELRSPPSSGREKLSTSAKRIRILGSINVMKGLRYSTLRETWGVWRTEFQSAIIFYLNVGGRNP